MKKILCISFFSVLLTLTSVMAQTYSPITCTGFNIDAIAESGSNSQAQTTQSLDGSNHVMYSANFAASAGFACGGILNSGTIVSGTRTYQLMPFNGNNALYTANGTTRTLNIATPAQYSLVSLLIFSTEGSSNINVTFNYTNATTTAFGPFTISDWFFAPGAVYSGFGRSTRVTSSAVCDGCPSEPQFYPLDFTLSCADQQKSLQSITITTTSGNQGAYVMAISGLAYTQTNTVTPVSNVSCNGANNGSATASISGSNSPFTYSWNSSPVQNTATASNLAPGNYTCTITDSKGCVTTTTVAITQPAPLTLTLTPTNASCGLNNASISASVGGGTPTYSFSINGGAFSTNSNFTGLTGGSYTVAAIDTKGCQVSATTSITANASPNISVNSAAVCNGNAATLIANGATTYAWSPSTGLSSVNGATVTANPATTTIYTVTGSAGACSGTATSTVSISPSPTVTVNSASVCPGSTAMLTANGATTYSWTPSTGLSNTSGNSVNANPATTTVYTVVGTSATCTSSATSTVTVNALPTITVNSASICAGQQTATLVANGANTYAWSPATGLGTTSGSSVNASPAATTVYTITGTDANNCSSTSMATVTVNAIPLVSVNSGTICTGGSTNLNAAGANTYSWSPGTGLSSTSGSAVMANPNSTTVYTITGTDANTCTNTATGTVTVVSNPNIVVNNASICLGQQTATLSASGATSYSWLPAGGLSSTSGGTVTANPNTTSVYTITGTVGTCTAQTTCTVSVNPLPTITVASAAVCANSTATLSASGASTYTWSTLAQAGSITVTPAATTNYTVAGTDGNGCINMAVATVTVNPAPNVTVNNAVICQGNSASLTANNAVTYIWSPAGGLSSTVGSNVSATPANTTQYTVTGTDANSCSNSAVATVTVNPLPVVVATSTAICKGNSATLNASGANSYNWNPSMGLSSASVANPTANPNGTTTYTVSGTDVNNCTNTAVITVSVNPLPVVNITPHISSGCAPLCVNFSNSGSASANAVYSWNFGNGTNSSAQAAQSCYANAGTYTTTLGITDSIGCRNTATATVNVYPVPQANFSSSPTTATILDPAVQFFDLSANAAISSWSWSFGDGDLSSLQNPQHVYTDTGTYYVQLNITSNYGCTATVTQPVRVDPEYFIYVPNAFTPNSDNVNDVFLPKGEGISLYVLQIYDRWGQEVFRSDDLNTGWDGRKGSEYLAQDVYVWTIVLHNFKDERKQLSGVVSLLK